MPMNEKRGYDIVPILPVEEFDGEISVAFNYPVLVEIMRDLQEYPKYGNSWKQLTLPFFECNMQLKLPFDEPIEASH